MNSLPAPGPSAPPRIALRANTLRQLKPAHLRLMAELLAAPQLGLAAARAGISQPAASRLLAEIEQLVGLALHERHGRGLALTPVGTALARRAARIQLELADAAREMAEAAAGASGVVRVGSVTGPALNLILPALTEIQRSSPGFHAEVVIATSETLCDHVRTGRVDFALGRLTGESTLLTATLFGGEPLSLLVRRGHPLLDIAHLHPADLMAHDWVMPDDETLLTQTVLQRLTQLGLPAPARQISTSSFLFTLALLTRTNAIAPLSTPVAETFSGTGQDAGLGATTAETPMPFVTLPINIGLLVAPFGLIRRAGTDLPPAPRRLADRITALAAEADWPKV